MKRVGEQQIDVRVAKAGVELNRQPLGFSNLQGAQDQYIVERFIRQADFAISRGAVLARRKPRRLPPGSIRVSPGQSGKR